MKSLIIRVYGKVQGVGYRYRVKNYDGSWTEWGNMVKAKVKKGYEP